MSVNVLTSSLVSFTLKKEYFGSHSPFWRAQILATNTSIIHTAFYFKLGRSENRTKTRFNSEGKKINYTDGDGLQFVEFSRCVIFENIFVTVNVSYLSTHDRKKRILSRQEKRVLLLISQVASRSRVSSENRHFTRLSSTYSRKFFIIYKTTTTKKTQLKAIRAHKGLFILFKFKLKEKRMDSSFRCHSGR